MRNGLIVVLSFALLQLISYKSYSQETISTSLSNFYIENNSVVYKRVFDLPNQNEKEVKAALLKFISKVPNVSNVRESGNEIFADISNMKINYQKYGGSYMSTLILLNHSMFAMLIVQIKDNKYRILIKDIYFMDDVSLLSLNSKKEMDNRTDLTPVITKAHASEFKSSSIIVKGMGYLNSQFTDLFTYTQQEDKW
jgi:hypothetical protein